MSDALAGTSCGAVTLSPDSLAVAESWPMRRVRSVPSPLHLAHPTISVCSNLWGLGSGQDGTWRLVMALAWAVDEEDVNNGEAEPVPPNERRSE